MPDIASDRLRATVLPEFGGGLARLDWLGRDSPVPLFRPWDGTSRDPNDLALYVLVPWSNRISGGGVEAGGRFWPLAANFPGEPCPLHGDGWLSPWTVEEEAPDRVRLSLRSTALPPFDYRAELAYAVAGPSLEVALAVEHLGAVEGVPYGLGLHPWLPRTPEARLRAPAAEIWLEDRHHLPAGKIAAHERPDWDFTAGRGLPAGWVNNGFSGWDGWAAADWPERRIRLEVAASPELATYVLFSRGAASGSFCFEPVSHPVDAFHLPGRPGLRALRRGERLAVSCRFTAAETG
jgi:aldose 1-epimerase